MGVLEQPSAVGLPLGPDEGDRLAQPWIGLFTDGQIPQRLPAQCGSESSNQGSTSTPRKGGPTIPAHDRTQLRACRCFARASERRRADARVPVLWIGSGPVTRLSSDEACHLLRRAGYDVGDVLGSGMEGVVVSLDTARVAKVWFDRSTDDVRRSRPSTTRSPVAADSGSPRSSRSSLRVAMSSRWSDSSPVVTSVTKPAGVSAR